MRKGRVCLNQQIGFLPLKQTILGCISQALFSPDTKTTDIQEKSLRNFNTVVTECFLRLSSTSLLSLFLRHWPMGPTGIPCLTPFLVPKAAICRSQKA